MTEKELLAARQSIVQKLTQARLEKGLSQEQLAKRIGTQRSNICRIEKGTQNLSLDLMLKIAEALDKDVSVMLEERSSTMEKVYSLRLYDETLLTFTLEERGLEGLQATILHSETAKQKLFPLDLELTNEGVVKWLERRVIPKNRQFVDEILKTLGLRKGGIEVVSCPTCGRTKIDLIGLANKVEEMVADIPLDIKVAVMGCVVNGPGEAKEADIGIAGGIGEGLLIKKGEVVKKVKEDELLETLRQELLHWNE